MDPLPNTPPLPDLSAYVVNRNAAIQLGKALFWDQSVGSDGQACASCHFSAGADARIQNILNPGGTSGTEAFGATGGTALRQARPNLVLTPADFPMRPGQNLRVSSAGTFGGTFVSLIEKRAREECNLDDGVFHITASDGVTVLRVRKVEPRQTPTTINAAFHFDTFWDGRAKNNFNGRNPFGLRDPEAKLIVKQTDGSLALQSVASELNNAALASQAVGPPLSDFEMGCGGGRSFAILGKKLLPRRALPLQQVASTDSVLGRLKRPIPILPGLRMKYRTMVQRAFNPALWSDTGVYLVDGGKPVLDTDGNLVPGTTDPADPNYAKSFKQEELNFAFFWGISIMLYESTLVSNKSKFDTFRSGTPTALTDQEKLGLEVFQNKGKCINCHDGPDFTKAGLHLQPENEEEGLVERMLMGLGQDPALYDNGFYNISVTQTAEDLGRGGTDPLPSNRPLSFTRQFKQDPTNPSPDPFQVNTCTFEIPFDPANCGVGIVPAEVDLANHRDAVDGAFKTAGLRNIALTPPYMHDGSLATLEQVVDFYNEGGNNGRGLTNNSEVDPDIQPLGLTDEEKQALVAFLKTLTDTRVACHKAPFDHPQLLLSVGHKTVDDNADGKADDIRVKFPAVGKYGVTANKCIPNAGDLFAPGMQKLITAVSATVVTQQDEAALQAQQDPGSGIVVEDVLNQ